MVVQAGMIFKHFKRDIVNDKGNNYLYKIESIATDADTGELVVVYKALYPPCKTWVRKLKDFTSEVDREKYPNAKQKYRFEEYKEKI